MSQGHSNHIPIRYKCVKIENTNEAISLVEFARRKHVEPNTVRYWLRKRKVKGYKVGGHWYIYQPSI